MLNRDLFSFDTHIRRQGHPIIAGIDEAGRGPWAGPVVAAIVIMPPDHCLPSINDSKKISPNVREKLFSLIIDSCIEYSVGIIDHTVIDEINILQATYKAFQHAVQKLTIPVDLILIDGNMQVPGLPYPYRSYIGGDGLSYSIACASILAKVTRDHIMSEFDQQYPGWNFAQHKGYGTAAHQHALNNKGISPIHRKSFRPIKKLICI